MRRFVLGARHRPDMWLVVLASTSLIAWSVLALDGSGFAVPRLCSVTTFSAVPPSVSLDLAFVLTSPAQLLSSWALMLAAMMPPLVVAPLRHVRERNFVRLRAGAMTCFVAGYAAVWMAAGAALQAIALYALWAVPGPLVRAAVMAMVAIVWQVSPAKQRCLNVCHRRPSLAAFGAAADRDAFQFGLSNGLACVGACWALMLLPLFSGLGHILAMLAVTLFIVAERLENPALPEWQWRGAGKALRILSSQVRMQLAP